MLLRKGQRLSGRDLMLAAAMNHPTLSVHRRPKVAVVGTGDELVPPGSTPGPGEIVFSNGFALYALARSEGCDVGDLGIARDKVEAIVAKVREARDWGADVLLTTGGASVGEHDLVQRALAAEGLDLSFWRVALRPGRPMMHGKLGAMQVLGVPGNPVSSYVCAFLFLVPLIRRLAGRADIEPRPVPARLGCDLPANDERQDYMRATLEEGPEGPVATPLKAQDSSLMANSRACRLPGNPGAARTGGPRRIAGRRPQARPLGQPRTPRSLRLQGRLGEAPISSIGRTTRRIFQFPSHLKRSKTAWRNGGVVLGTTSISKPKGPPLKKAYLMSFKRTLRADLMASEILAAEASDFRWRTHRWRVPGGITSAALAVQAGDDLRRDVAIHRLVHDRRSHGGRKGGRPGPFGVGGRIGGELLQQRRLEIVTKSFANAVPSNMLFKEGDIAVSRGLGQPIGRVKRPGHPSHDGRDNDGRDDASRKANRAFPAGRRQRVPRGVRRNIEDAKDRIVLELTC